MSKLDYEIGSSKVEDYWKLINERHQVYLNKKAEKPKPWTKDWILQQYKFCNVFRELDTGTIALRQHTRTLVDAASEDLEMLPYLLWTVCWYRLFNEVSNLTDFTGMGLPKDPDDLYSRLLPKYHRDAKVFTSAHMTTGIPGETKIVSYRRAVDMVWQRKEDLAHGVFETGTLQNAFNLLLPLYMIGKFNAYEMVCDFRWTPLLRHATDKLTWANVGPGAKRGLQRMGLDPSTAGMVELYSRARAGLGKHVIDSYLAAISGNYLAVSGSDTPIWLDGYFYPPFELREIEHCLCEFDKYERTRSGVGTPRQRYPGKPDGLINNPLSQPISKREQKELFDE